MRIFNYEINDKIFATVSGVLTTNPETIRRVDSTVPNLAIITTKSYELNPNPGNPEPIIVEDNVGTFGNSVGLKNPGMEQGLKDLKDLRSKYKMSSLLNVSLSGKRPGEFIELADNFKEVADILELNFSCPNAASGYGSSIGSDSETVYDYVREIKKTTDLPILVKLTPNVDDIGTIALAAINGGANGITAINTVGPKLFIEPHSKEPVLINPKNGFGGKSGRDIKTTALQKVREIREAIGNDYPILGVGGIENSYDVKEMQNAGATIVGIGSLWARLHPDNWKSFFNTLYSDVKNNTNYAQKFVTNKRLMEYNPYTIERVYNKSDGVKVFELNSKFDFDASQFAFIWIPSVGEKPFSIVKSDPLTFIIKDRGKVSKAICNKKEQETIYVRGPYGQRPPITSKENVIVIVGGTGVAVAPKLTQYLLENGKNVEVYIGDSNEGPEIFKDYISKFAPCEMIYDNGQIARVIGHLIDKKKDFSNYSIYTIGPKDFMDRSVKAFTKYGGNYEDAFLSVEKNVRCGVGLCGECSCGGHLTCKEGTFISAKFLEDK